MRKFVDTSEWVTHRYKRPKDKRFYEGRLEQALWGEFVLTKVWGSMKNGQGGFSRFPVKTREEGLLQLQAIAPRRKERGYQRVYGPNK